jgi:hypothetical protein
MSKALRLTKIDMQRAGQLAQAGCRVTFHPNGDISVEPDAKTAKPVKDDERPRRNVYFILSEITGLIKIGISKDPDYRRLTLEREHGPVRILHLLEGYRFEERELHARFADQRERFEWFRCEGPLAEYLKTECGHAP